MLRLLVGSSLRRSILRGGFDDVVCMILIAGEGKGPIT
jgi:hypothetical protein